MENKHSLINEIKYQKEMLKMARTPHQRDTAKHKMRLAKEKLRLLN